MIFEQIDAKLDVPEGFVPMEIEKDLYDRKQDLPFSYTVETHKFWPLQGKNIKAGESFVGMGYSKAVRRAVVGADGFLPIDPITKERQVLPSEEEIHQETG